MRRALGWLAALGLLLTAIGCGGSGSSTPLTRNITRYVTGYVYVKSTANPPTGPEIMITGSTTAPTGYFKPTAGTITLGLTNGTLIGRAPATYVRTLTDGNDIIVAATTDSATPTLTVTAAGVQLNGTARTTFGNSAAAYTENLGLVSDNDTTFAMASPGSPSYTPGTPASIKITVNGEAPPANLVSGGTYSYAVAVYDVNGVVVPGATPVVTSSVPATVAVSGSTLVPALAATSTAPGNVVITAALATGTALTESFTANFNYGTPTTVTVTPATTTKTWATASGADAGPAFTVNYTATVQNEFGAAMFNTAVAWTNAKAPSNAWPDTSACFASAGGNTNSSGQLAVVLTGPAPANGVLSGAAKGPKGDNSIVATAGTATGSATLTIVRPLATLNITGPSRLDVNGANSPTPGTAGAYAVTSAQDVDNDVVTTPTVTWSRTNVVLGNIGNTGDFTTGTVSNATIDASTGVVTPGNQPGTVTVTATSGSVTAAVVTTEVFGVPSKIYLTPDTNDTAANTYKGANGTTKNFSITLLDNAGHTILPAELTGFNTTAATSSGSGANITLGGAAVTNFTLTFGPAGGNMTLTATGTWTGTKGGGPTAFNITRQVLIIP